MKSHSPSGLPLALPFGILAFLVAISLIATANKKVNTIEVVPASGSVTQEVVKTNVTIVHDRGASLSFVPAKSGMSNGVQTGGLNSK